MEKNCFFKREENCKEYSLMTKGLECFEKKEVTFVIRVL